MKQKIFYPLLLIVLTISTAPSCKKTNTEDQLPPETHVGAFTFGCKVNGKIYTASGKGGGLLGFDHVYFRLGSTDSSVNIGAGSVSDEKNKFSISFTIKYSGNLGTYLMKTYPYEGIFIDQSNGSVPGGVDTFTTTDNYTGGVTLKYFDGSYNPYYSGTILAGTFQMDAINGDGKVIHITEGRFDIGQ